MPRKPRIHYEGALYHVIARGNNKEDVLAGDRDKQKYLALVEKYKQKYLFRLYAYVLMSNHLHMLLQVGSVPLSKIMQGIQQSYTQYFNNKYGRIGHVFQQRYKAILCDQDVYLLELIRYIHNNPVKAGLSVNLDYWWSSHGYYVNPETNSLVDVDLPLSLFAGNRGEAINKYLEFMQAEGSLPENWEGRSILGGDDFIAQANKRPYESNDMPSRLSQDMVLQLVVNDTNLTLEQILRGGKRRDVVKARQRLVYLLSTRVGMTDQEIADYLQTSLATVSRYRNQASDICDLQPDDDCL